MVHHSDTYTLIVYLVNHVKDLLSFVNCVQSIKEEVTVITVRYYLDPEMVILREVIEVETPKLFIDHRIVSDKVSFLVVDSYSSQ